MFVLGTQATRLPVGSLLLGHGCDDVLSGAVVAAPGTIAALNPLTEWTLNVPPLPPGFMLFFQHVSFCVVGNTVYFGATNVAQYRT